MRRINKYLLLIAMLAVVSLLAFSFFRMGKEHEAIAAESAPALEGKSLKSDPLLDAQGRAISTAAISVDRVIREAEWEDWSLALLAASRPETPAKKRSSRGEREYPGDFEHGSFVGSNVVLRNASTGDATLLFDRKVATVELDATAETAAVLLVFADADTNKDDRITRDDRLRLSYFSFANPAEVHIPFKGSFLQFDHTHAAGDPFRFKTVLDLNNDGKFDRTYDVLRVYEIDPATGAVTAAVNAEMIAKAQAIVDGAAAE